MTITARPLPARPAAVLARLPAAPPANATLLERRPVGQTSALFTLRLDSPLAGYRPGQYVGLGLVAGNGLVQRPYSVVSTDDGRRNVELFVRHVAGGELTPALWRLTAGARLRIGPARGLFTIEDGRPSDRLFVGAGTGVAPLLAMLEELSRLRSDGRVTLIHAASFADELVFADRAAAWQGAGLDVEYRPTVSRPFDARNGGWRGLTGRAEGVLAAHVRDARFEARTTFGYVCGNPAMVDSCSAILRGAGLTPDSVRVERF